MEVYIGTICAFGFNFAPYQWLKCQGQLLPINQNTALFSLLGTYYGGNGTSNFGLPNLGNSVAIGQGSNGPSNYVIGETGGSNTVSILTSNMPAHVHPVSVTLNANNRALSSTNPVNNFCAQSTTSSTPGNYSTVVSPGAYMKPPTITLGIAGGSIPVSIQDPVLVLNCCVSLYGIFPPRS